MAKSRQISKRRRYGSRNRRVRRGGQWFSNMGQKPNTGFQGFRQNMSNGLSGITAGMQNMGQRATSGMQNMGQRASSFMGNTKRSWGFGGRRTRRRR